MKELKEDIQKIRESQLRMEIDMRYHIKRTDLLEARLDEHQNMMAPLYVFNWFKGNYKFLIFLTTLIAGLVYIINKKM